MARDLSALFKEEAVASEQSRLYHLISFVGIPTLPNPTDIHIVDANDDVSFGGIFYLKFPVSFNGVEMTGSGEINKATLTVANPERQFQAYLNAYNGLRGVRVMVKTVFANFLDDGATPDSSACVEDEFLIDSYTATETVIQFSLDPVCDFNLKLPRRRFTNICYWRYKEADTCGYAGALPDCKKDLEACRERGNQMRFGGFPGIPTQARRVIF